MHTLHNTLHTHTKFIPAIKIAIATQCTSVDDWHYLTFEHYTANPPGQQPHTAKRQKDS